MAEIKLCDIINASIVQREDGSRHITMRLPKSSKAYDKQKTPSNEWVLEVYDELLRTGSVEFATPENPTHPTCGGTIDVVGNYSSGNYHILLTRKDQFSPRDPGGHVPNNGFPVDESEWRDPSLIISSEGAEERFYYTRDGNLLIPNDPIGVYATIEAATRTGLLKFEDRSKIDDSRIAYINGPDTLDVVDSNGNQLYRDNGFFIWSSKTGPNFIKLREIDASLDEIIPYDGEGIFKPDGNFFPFQREVFVFGKGDLKDLAYGGQLEVNRTESEEPVYIWETNQGKRQIQTKKPDNLDDVYKPCPVVQRVIGQILNPKFNAIEHEIGETRKRIESTYDANPTL
jgi:hypothetical protein